MKFLSALIVMLMIAGTSHCEQENDVESFRYEAATRGSLYEVSVTKDSIKVRSGLKGMELHSGTLKSGEWASLIKASRTFSYTEMNEFTTSGEKRFVDAAPAAFLEINTSEGSHRSTEFDHGNPPEQLGPLVKAILTLAETVE